MKLKPLFDRVVLKPINSNTNKTQSGLILPDSSTDKPQIAEVVAVGSGVTGDGKETKMQVKPQDTVLYSRFGGIEFKLDETNLVIIRQSDILGVMEEK